VNEYLDAYQKGQLELPELSGRQAPMHLNFV
jgi:hypothetical protein